MLYDSWICPATGHVVNRRKIGGTILPSEASCPDHGVPLFRDCAKCGERWTTKSKSYSNRPTDGRNFCSACGTRAPWLERADLVAWLRNQVKASRDLSTAARAELVAVLDRLTDMDPSDDKAIPVWRRLHELAPKVYAATKPVRDALMSETVKRALDAYFGSG
jgi:hypothetical protein